MHRAHHRLLNDDTDGLHEEEVNRADGLREATRAIYVGNVVREELENGCRPGLGRQSDLPRKKFGVYSAWL